MYLSGLSSVSYSLRTIIGAFALVVFALAWQPVAGAERRVALVIGNGAYQNATRLPNPANDARAMADMLRSSGFEVLSGFDLTREAMETLIGHFEEAVQNADVSVAFYAGHGSQVDGRNYLFPVDATGLEQRSDLRRLIPADWLIEDSGRAGKLALVILDACRDNPLTRSLTLRDRGLAVGRGLARIQYQPPNMLIAYATAEGATAVDGTGRNSPFTSALVEHLPTPGLEIGLALRKVRDTVIGSTGGKQQPYTYGSLGGEEFYFVAREPVTLPSPPTMASLTYGGRDREAFDAIEDSKRARDFEIFVERFPDSTLVPFALDRLTELRGHDSTALPDLEAGPSPPAMISTPDVTAPSPSAQAALPPITPAVVPPADTSEDPAKSEAALGLSRTDWRDIQLGLKALGFDPDGALDGIPAEATRRALATWQAREGKEVTGYVLREQRDTIVEDPSVQINVGKMYYDGHGVEQDNAEAARWFRKAADRGLAAAQNNLGAMYDNGRGVKRDDAEAVRWFRKAADQGLAAAQANLAIMYGNGRGVKRSDAEAVRWYRKAADQGDVTAQANLGAMYDNGRGVEQDDAEAVRWYRKAADQGDVTAQANLGAMYDNGRGVEQDDAEAVRWFRKAADQGLAIAQNNLGAMYDNGQGVKRDDAEAVRWYRKAADQGHPVAQGNLGIMYGNGRGAKRNDAEAARWFRKAADRGFAAAQNNLGAMYDNGRGVKRDDVEAVRWFRKAADQGYAAAQANLGIMYGNGRGVKQDDAEAARWFRKAAEQGDATAQYNLGRMYSLGEGVAQDYPEAARWTRKAADQGNVDAQTSLGIMYENGRGVNKNQAEAMHWFGKAAKQSNASTQNTKKDAIRLSKPSVSPKQIELGLY